MGKASKQRRREREAIAQRQRSLHSSLWIQSTATLILTVLSGFYLYFTEKEYNAFHLDFFHLIQSIPSNPSEYKQLIFAAFFFRPALSVALTALIAGLICHLVLSYAHRNYSDKIRRLGEPQNLKALGLTSLLLSYTLLLYVVLVFIYTLFPQAGGFVDWLFPLLYALSIPPFFCTYYALLPAFFGLALGLVRILHHYSLKVG